MEDLSSFYIQKVLDQIIGRVKNTSILRHGSLFVKTRTDNQSRKHFKHKLPSSYPVLVEKHKTLISTRGVIFCSQVDRRSEKEIQTSMY
jgi:hypothetical protein